jgi:DNA-binding FadR family transcriptional regulator
VAPGLQGRPFRIDPEELESLAEILRVMELRLGVEVEAAGLAAERRTEANLTEIRERIEAIDEAIAQDESGVDADFAFHRSILAAADNPYFPRFLEFLGRFIIPRQSVRVRYATGGEQRAYLERVQAEHRAIYEAVRAAEPEAAREASRRHLCNSLERYRDMAAALDGAGAGGGRARGKPARR